ncbi:MAG: transglutaminase family protein [Sinimarinibacterium flocculans]|uniref:transglutaminase family protein n=1 Tax=Sinimarinibacterium flocculans TaxID=985250 RepID=UPI003C5EB7F1
MTLGGDARRSAKGVVAQPARDVDEVEECRRCGSGVDESRDVDPCILRPFPEGNMPTVSRSGLRGLSTMEMQVRRYRIVHNTYYNFAAPVELGPHTLRLRPREGHDLRIEASTLEIDPPATLQWHRDAESNSVATARFSGRSAKLAILSELIVQQFPPPTTDPCGATFSDTAVDEAVLSPYLGVVVDSQLTGWLPPTPRPATSAQSHAVLETLCRRVQQVLHYRVRDEPGVQSVAETLQSGSGSCRDFAHLFIEAARSWGYAARFVSGYLHAAPSPDHFGATHAWAEVYVVGCGWCGFDPTLGRASGPEHFPVSVARLPESVPPVAGSITGPAGTTMDVGVWVTELPVVA